MQIDACWKMRSAFFESLPEHQGIRLRLSLQIFHTMAMPAAFFQKINQFLYPSIFTAESFDLLLFIFAYTYLPKTQ